MNKYQEALDIINRVAFKQYEDVCYSKTKKSRAINYESLLIRSANIFQELVDKEKPMKPLHISLLSNPPQNIIACGNCKGNNLGQSFKYCPSCRQKIDWNDEE